jgi:ABC-type dipeptide/oligopeptide/nickel transport system permease component
MAERHLNFLLSAARRLSGLVVTFLAVSFLLFLAIRAIPGDPVALRLKNPDPVQVAEERARLGLDRPLPVQFVRQARDFWTGEWGSSFGTGRSVWQDVGAFLPATLELAVAAVLLGVVAGATWALLAEWSASRIIGALSYSVGMAGLTVPIYWIGLLLIIAGSLWLGWFPPGGRLPAGVEGPGITGFLLVDAVAAGRPALLGEAIRYLFLPAVCLSLYPAAQVCATLRARLRDPRVQWLLVGLRARGINPLRIWLVHILKLLAGPVVTIVGTTFGVLLGGAVLTETIFSWPGMGRYLVGAVLDRDIYVIQNALLLVLFLVLAVVQVSDLLAAWLNPRVLEENEEL